MAIFAFFRPSFLPYLMNCMIFTSEATGHPIPAMLGFVAFGSVRTDLR